MRSISTSPAEGAKNFKTPWIETPLVESATLSRLAGCRIFLKLENVQPSGSFKSRAMGNQILAHLLNPAYANRRIHFFASSGGNAGLAAVCAARSLGYPCTVVVPLSTRQLMVEKLRAAGAEDVICYGETFSEAGEYMREVVMKTNERDADADADAEDEDDVVKIALHPFDKESIWQGNSTIADELARQLPLPEGMVEEEMYRGRALSADAIVCSVGGGGLLNGLVMGLERLRNQKEAERQSSTAAVFSSGKTDETDPADDTTPIHLFAVETAGTDSLALALAQKSLVSLPKITSQATSLGAIRVSKKTFQYATSPPRGIKVHSAVLSDAQAAKGVLRLVNSERLLVELACGVCVEAAVGNAIEQPSGGNLRSKCKRAASSSAGRSHHDEGYGDDRSSTGNETETEGELETDISPTTLLSDASGLKSKLKQLVPELGPHSRVVLIVCGGSNVTIDMAAEWRKMLEKGWK